MTTDAGAGAGAASATGRPEPRSAELRLRGRTIPVLLPDLADPRLKLSAVLMTLQVLGQTVLGFKLSIAQILLPIVTCATIEIVLTFRDRRVLAWPSSAILTGNSIAFILRASGTRHGDWWGLRGGGLFVAAAVLAMLSKHLIRPGGRHLFNPSNVALVWILLVVGPARVFPQYLWWGPWEAPVIAAYLVILVGGAWVLRAVAMTSMAAAFLLTYGGLVAVAAAVGRSFVAVWREADVSGFAYWANIALSPELLIFVFFMMSDPQTTPAGRRARVGFGAATAVVAAGLTAVQTTEFGIKVAILSSLTVTCAITGLLERRPAGHRDGGRSAARMARAATNPAIAAAIIVAVAAPVDTLRLARDEQLLLIERGLTARSEQQ